MNSAELLELDWPETASSEQLIVGTTWTKIDMASATRVYLVPETAGVGFYLAPSSAISTGGFLLFRNNTATPRNEPMGALIRPKGAPSVWVRGSAAGNKLNVIRFTD